MSSKPFTQLPASRFLLAAMAATAFSLPAQAATNLILNGGFEADQQSLQSPDPISHWRSAEQGLLGGVNISGGRSSPVTGAGTVGAASGSYYALLDTAGLGQLALAQDFSVSQPLQSAQLSFDWFANYGGTQVAPVGANFGLDYTAGDSYASNVQVRLDILKSSASAFSTAASDVLWSHSLSSLSAGPHAYQHQDISLDAGLLQANQGYTLRFALVSNDGQLLGGIDNVALNVTSAVPEPQTGLLLLGGLGLLAALRRKATV